jgi:hypothetical protein
MNKSRDIIPSIVMSFTIPQGTASLRDIFVTADARCSVLLPQPDRLALCHPVPRLAGRVDRVEVIGLAVLGGVAQIINDFRAILVTG